MRAFMSDVNGGPEWLDHDHVTEGCFGMRGEEFAAEWAIREAERILGETEPFVPSADYFNVGRKSDTEHSQCGRLAMCSPMYQALAEALRAFVEEEDCR